MVVGVRVRLAIPRAGVDIWQHDSRYFIELLLLRLAQASKFRHSPAARLALQSVLYFHECLPDNNEVLHIDTHGLERRLNCLRMGKVRTEGTTLERGAVL